MEDAELIRRIQGGEVQHLGTLIERHYASIGKYCYYHTGDAEAAQDLTQETFYRFSRHIQDYRHAGKCRAYLYTIARNLCRDYFRAKRAYPLADVPEEAAPMWMLEEAVSAKLGFHDLIAGLPKELQELIVLRYSYDLTFREIAEITGKPLYLVQYKVKRALVALKKKAEVHGHDEHKAGRPAAQSQPLSASPRS